MGCQGVENPSRARDPIFDQEMTIFKGESGTNGGRERKSKSEEICDHLVTEMSAAVSNQLEPQKG